MEGHVVSFLLLVVAVEVSTQNSFFISAPTVFHRGVKEKVVVQMGKPHLRTSATLYLEDETTGIVVSDRKPVRCASETDIQTVELMINWDTWSALAKKHDYLLLVAESPSFTDRKITKVLVSQHRGYIFLQTHQPVYSPAQQVSYRIFTLDHKMRPHEEMFILSVFNPDGNRVLQMLRSAQGGILTGMFPIPSMSRSGTWKIIAHYEDDEANPASVEFKVQKFVLPSFDVNIEMEQKYILLGDEELVFTVSAMYSYGEKVKGAYHCQFGVATKDENNKIKHELLKGLEVAGSVLNGKATISVRSAVINSKLRDQMKKSLSQLLRKKEKVYIKVFVTNIQSGEIQEADVYLPVFTHKYTIDLSRTRSHVVPGYPLDVVVFLRLPDGSPATGVPVTIEMQTSSRETVQDITDQEGAASTTFNTADDRNDIIVEVSADGLRESKAIRRFSSPSNGFLYMTFTNKIYSVNDVFSVTYNTRNAPVVGHIYYLVLSRGTVVKQGSIQIGTSVKQNLQITADMVPSFRLIGYFHHSSGGVIADSVWVDVRDECEIKVEVTKSGPSRPGKESKLHIDLHGQQARVALLAVDKAFYALNADNKLTSQQVFSRMKSYDLGCSYGGGPDSGSVLVDAGLSFVSQGQSDNRKDFSCNSAPVRQGRSIDLQVERISLRSTFNDTDLQECCFQGFSLLPMRRTCEERTARVLLVRGTRACADAFLKCCTEGERLRQKKMQEDALNGFGRTSTMEDIEQFFLGTSNQYIRRYFPPSFEFREISVNGKISHALRLPDSITTWEVQVVTLSAATGFCVVKPTEVKAFQNSFVSLRLPYSVKKYEQLSISPVVYNYGDERLEVALNMEQSEGLCSPGSATTTSFVNFTVEPQSSHFVSFSVVPMKTGSIPIKIRLYDMEDEWGVDAIEKTLFVQSEGLEKREESTHVIKLDETGKSSKNFTVDGTLPRDTVPESSSNIFISMEGEGFGSSHAKNLLSPKMVADLIVLPDGCVEQTMRKLVPTALAIRYLDLSEQWFELPAGKRDQSLDELEKGFIHIINHRDKRSNGAYQVFPHVPYSNWMTAFIVKVLSLVAERQVAVVGQQGRRVGVVPFEGIRKPVQYLLSVQNPDGSFSDQHPVLYRQLLTGDDERASVTAFITIALKRSLEFLEMERRNEAEASISRATSYLKSLINKLQHPYAVAITAHCLSICLPKEDHSAIWTKLLEKATKADSDCYLWTADNNKNSRAAIAISATAYALLTAVELGHMKWANQIACWLTAQENYIGSFKSTQDTMMALEALAEYELKRSLIPEAHMRAEFTTPSKNDIVTLQLERRKEKVETDLKKFTGNNINVQLTGKGEVKMKVLKKFHVLEDKDDCAQLSISVTVEGKVKYTAQIMKDYEYYDYEDEQKQDQAPQSPIERFDARTRNRRAPDNDLYSENVVTYKVCVSHSLSSSLTGMAIADITLLSGFEADVDDLEMLKQPPEKYITHYEVSYGKVLIYFNELFEQQLCVEFDAEQKVAVGLLQPAPAVFYDYYEPDKKCTVFYSAPLRSKMVSKLCSEDVCQCAERPCHKVQETFKLYRNRRLTKHDRVQHACFAPTVDYAFIVNILSVSMKSNFALYRTNVTGVLRSNTEMENNPIRVFAVRLHCKARLDVGKSYLIMGKDGVTTDSDGMMQYLLESSTWVERVPSEGECKKSSHRTTCRSFHQFTDEYKTDGCTQ